MDSKKSYWTIDKDIGSIFPSFFCNLGQKSTQETLHLIWQTGMPFDPHNNPLSYLRKRVGELYKNNRRHVDECDLSWQPPLLSSSDSESSLNGSPLSRNSCFTSGWCHTMSRHAGIQHTTCLNSPLNIMKLSMRSLETRGWNWDNLSWRRTTGKSRLTSAMFWRCVIIPRSLIIN